MQEMEAEEKNRKWYYDQIEMITRKIRSLPVNDTVSYRLNKSMFDTLYLGEPDGIVVEHQTPNERYWVQSSLTPPWEHDTLTLGLEYWLIPRKQ